MGLESELLDIGEAAAFLGVSEMSLPGGTVGAISTPNDSPPAGPKNSPVGTAASGIASSAKPGLES